MSSQGDKQLEKPCWGCMLLTTESVQGVKCGGPFCPACSGRSNVGAEWYCIRCCRDIIQPRGEPHDTNFIARGNLTRMAEHDKAINELREKHQTEITALKK